MKSKKEKKGSTFVNVKTLLSLLRPHKSAMVCDKDLQPLTLDSFKWVRTEDGVWHFICAPKTLTNSEKVIDKPQ